MMYYLDFLILITGLGYISWVLRIVWVKFCLYKINKLVKSI